MLATRTVTARTVTASIVTTRRTAMRLALGTAVALSLAAPLAAQTAPSEGSVYVRGNTADPETLDQHKTSTTYEANVLRDLYEGLVIYDAAAQVVPGVAESWEVSDDGLTYTFTLREDAKWSNGDAITAEDFVYSLQRIMTPETGAKYANILYPIAGAEAVNKGEAEPDTMGVTAIDERTLEIKLENPTPFFLELLTHQTGLPVHRPSVEEHGADFVRPENMVTNGAYTLQEFTPNQQIVVVKNPEFHAADSVMIDEVRFIPTEDRSAALRRFQAGELLSNNDVPQEQIEFMETELGPEQFRVSPYLGTYYYSIKADKEPFSDPKVRQALSMAIDREFLADEIAPAFLPAYSFVPAGIANYGDGADAPKFAFDGESMLDREDEAKRLLEEAGFGPDNPLEVEISYNTSENHKNIATAIADMWAPLGVEVTLSNQDTATHYAGLRDGADYDVARAGWIGDYNDPENFLSLYKSDNLGFNYSRYNNPEYDALLDEAAATTDLDARADILKRAERMLMDDVGVIPIFYYTGQNLVSPKLKGWVDNIQNAHASRFMSIEE